MPSRGVWRTITDLLVEMSARGGYPLALVCTEQGLLIAAAGEHPRSEAVAGLTGLFDDIALRVARDLELGDVDEFTVCTDRGGRMVVRSLGGDQRPRIFLVVQVPSHRTWRRNTATIARKIRAILRPLIDKEEELS